MLDVAAARRWATDSVAALARDRESIDRINVFPVADRDTGTNLLWTMRAALHTMDAAAPDALGDAVAALAKGALSGARGNSGMLLSQILRGLAEEFQHVSVADAACLRRALARASVLARQAVTEPREGTLLSVLYGAVAAAESDAPGDDPSGEDASAAMPPDDVGRVTRAAVSGAVRALERTPGQLPVLAEAGVVDAGGRGVVVLLDVLHAVLVGSRVAEAPPEAGSSIVLHHDSPFAYEVMYSLSGVDEAAVPVLRDGLAGLGDCVSVVGDGAGAWAVHVHCDDIGPAIELGIDIGRVRGIEVTRFADRKFPEHAVLACVRGGAIAELFRAEGADVCQGDDGTPGAADLGVALGAIRARHVVVLPNDPEVTEFAEEAARRAVRGGQDVVVVPTASPIQGLAALAVHDPGRRSSEDAVAMAEAAAATRRGELVFADQEALTWAGRCQPGDVLGLADGEVVVLGAEETSAARALLDRMLTAGGELVTALVSARAPACLARELAEHLRRTHPEVELTCYDGGDLHSPLLLGVE